MKIEKAVKHPPTMDDDGLLIDVPCNVSPMYAQAPTSSALRACCDCFRSSTTLNSCSTVWCSLIIVSGCALTESI